MNHSSQRFEPVPAPGDSAQALHVPALLAAAVAALIGAVAWALIAWLTGYEVGYVAWGIGLLVGLAAVKVGGRGVATASTAAAMTIAAIFVGKVLGTHLLVEKEFEQVREQYFTAEVFQELQRDASAWQDMPPAPSDEDLRQFMVEYGFGGFLSADEIADEDLEYFRAYSIPVLEQFDAERPGFEAWRDSAFSDYRHEFESEFSLASAVVSELNAFDLIFAFLAVSTAYGMISRAAERREEPPSEGGGEEPPHTHEMRRAA